MTHLLAEGGYQAFVFSGSEKTWLYLALVCALAAIVVALFLVRGVLATDSGTASMVDIAKAVQEGAEAFLARQFKTIGIIIVPLAVLIFFTATKVTHTHTFATEALPGSPSASQFIMCRDAPKAGLKSRLQFAAELGFQIAGDTPSCPKSATLDFGGAYGFSVTVSSKIMAHRDERSALSRFPVARVANIANMSIGERGLSSELLLNGRSDGAGSGGKLH